MVLDLRLSYVASAACESDTSFYFVKHFKNNIMERPIGDTFYMNNDKFEIIHSPTNRCDDCCFTSPNCVSFKDYIGFCGAAFREDKKNISVKRLNNQYHG